MTTPTKLHRDGGDVASLLPAPEVVQIEVGLLQNFCEILFCPETRAAAIVDPAWEADRLLRECEARGLRVTHALITHTHEDHIEGVEELVRRTGAAVVVSPREAEALARAGGTRVDAIDRAGYRDRPLRRARARTRRGTPSGGRAISRMGF